MDDLPIDYEPLEYESLDYEPLDYPMYNPSGEYISLENFTFDLSNLNLSAMDLDWSLPELFPDYDPEVSRILEYVVYLTTQIGDYLDEYTIFIAIFGIFLNILHFIVLTRKSILTNSTSLILASLAINSTMGLSVELYDKTRDYFAAPSNPLCFPINLLKSGIFLLVMTTLRKHWARCSAWLIILMAVVQIIRPVDVENPRFASTSTIKFGAVASLFVYLICTSASSIIVWPYLINVDLKDPDVKILWQRDNSCVEHSPIESQWEYAINQPPELFELLSLIDGYTIYILPTLVCPILTIFLIKVLMKEKRVQAQEGNRIECTTSFALAMTISFLIVKTPQTIAFSMKGSKTLGFDIMSDRLHNCFERISQFNNAIHFFYCFVLSSNYRNTFYDLRRFTKNKYRSAKVDVAIPISDDIEAGQGTSENNR